MYSKTSHVRVQRRSPLLFNVFRTRVFWNFLLQKLKPHLLEEVIPCNNDSCASSLSYNVFVNTFALLQFFSYNACKSIQNLSAI